jgi:hypothetical protein
MKAASVPNAIEYPNQSEPVEIGDTKLKVLIITGPDVLYTNTAPPVVVNPLSTAGAPTMRTDVLADAARA